MEEIPVLGNKERAELLDSLKKAEQHIRDGKGTDYDPKKFKDRLLDIYWRAKRA